VGAGTLSKQTHFEELQRRDVVTVDRTWEDELARLGVDAAQSVTEAATRATALAKANGTNPSVGNAING
jgi:hypothetical protein